MKSEMVRKPQRALWELNNLHAQYWGLPQNPKPEDGFAQEQVQPGFPDVCDWFRDAIPEHCRKVPILRADVVRIARLVGEFQAMLARPYNPLIDIVHIKKIGLQRACAELKKALSDMLELFSPDDHRCDPSVIPLVNLMDAVGRAGLSIGSPPKQGQKQGQMMPLWYVWAASLAAHIAKVLKDLGAPASVKFDSPLVKIICRALATIDGSNYPQNTVVSALKRHRRKRRGGASFLKHETPLSSHDVASRMQRDVR
jgi:hypothetical protein